MSLWDAPTKCSSWKRFKGTRDPKCRGGQGCTMCWKKRLDVLFTDVNGVSLSVDEMKELAEKMQERLREDELDEKPYRTMPDIRFDRRCPCCVKY